jgi:ribosome-binding ATPase YchF (GTP1/OBG family)
MNDAAVNDTVTLSRADYEALLDRLEDFEDMATLDRLEARLAADPEGALTDYLPIELVKRLSAGEHPIRVWRAHRGMTRELKVDR